MRNFATFILTALILTSNLEAQAPESLKMSFDDAVAQALDQSYVVQRAHIDVLSAHTDRLKTVAQIGPHLKATYTDVTNNQELSTTDDKGQKIVFQPLRSQQGGISASVNLSAIVAGLVKIRSQTAQINLSKRARELAATETAFGVAEVYRRVQQTKEAVAIAQARLETTAKQKKDSESLFAYGKISKAEKLQIDLVHNRSLLGLANAQNESLDAQAQLKKLLNTDENAVLELDPLKNLTADMLPEINAPGDALSEALANRNDVAVAQLKTAAFEKGRWLAFASYLPLVDVSMNWQKSFGDVSVLSSSESQNFTIRATWDFWDNGAGILDFRKATLDYRKARIDEREQLYDVKNNVDAALRGIQLAKEALVLNDVGLEQAQESYRGNAARFALGALSVTDLLLSESSLNDAKRDRLAAVVGIDIAYMKLQKALGKKRPVPL